MNRRGTMSGWRWLLVVVLVGFAGMFLFELPSLRRYLKMKRM